MFHPLTCVLSFAGGKNQNKPNIKIQKKDRGSADTVNITCPGALIELNKFCISYFQENDTDYTFKLSVNHVLPLQQAPYFAKLSLII